MIDFVLGYFDYWRYPLAAWLAMFALGCIRYWYEAISHE